MADPIITPQLLAAAGAGVGALMKPRNPIQGALLGGIAGYTGGTALGVGAAPAATTAATGGATNSLLGSQMAAQPALSYGANNLIAPAAMDANAAGLSFAGMSPGATTVNAAPSFMEKIGMAGKSAYENPMMTAQALSATNSLLTPDQMPPSAPAMPLQAGRGVKPYDPTEALNPYKQSVVGGQPISLI